MKKPIFCGSGVAIITPFSNGKIDYDSFHSLLDRQIESGTDAVIVCGTTGEASTLSKEERRNLIADCAAYVKHRVPVIAGTGSNSTETAIAQSLDAQACGADALLLVTPYYNKATQDGLIAHFTAIADAVSLPIILYNVPSRTGVCCEAETYRTLAAHPNIIGVKEASGALRLLQQTRCLCPDDFYIWCGNDEETVSTMAHGAVGVISVTANIVPKEMHTMASLCLNDKISAAGALQLRLFDLNKSLFCEVNPIPVKYALSRMHLCQNEFRLPLCPISPENAAVLNQVLVSLSLLS